MFLVILASSAFVFACTKTEISPQDQRGTEKPSLPQTEDSNNTQPKIDNDPTVSGQDYFEGQVIPKFNQCKRCHVSNETPIEAERGPLTIFDYAAMKALLEQNTLLPMVRAQLPERQHPMSDPCLAGLNSSPCREIAKWWNIEFGDDPSKENDRPLPLTGTILDVSPDGIVTGWAINPRDQKAIITVNFYVNGALLGNVPANLDTFDNENPGGHGFLIPLEAPFKNGQRMDLTITAVINNDEEPLRGSPFSFAALSKVAAGNTYFDETLKNQIIANCGCHGSSFSYDFAWVKLANPLATENGTATNNLLFQKASGQTQHAGGNSCQGNPTCQGISEWWNLEFGALP